METLTPEQEALFPKYVDKWFKIGINTDRLDYDRTVDIIDMFLVDILCRKKEPVVIVDNPLEAWVGCCLFVSGMSSINDLKSNIDKVFNKEIEVDFPDPLYPYQDGSFFVSYFTFYDFFLREVPEIEVDDALREKYFKWQETAELGLIYPLNGLCIVTQKPTVINLNDDYLPHCDGGPALEYAGHGDFKMYCLNGITVPEELAVLPSSELSIDLFNNERNADVRTEFLKKFGIERMLDKGTKVDSYENYDEPWWTKSEYELWDMNELFSSIPYAPYLKMKNQTTGVWHVEAVSPNCETLRDAIKERFNGRDFSIQAIA